MTLVMLESLPSSLGVVNRQDENRDSIFSDPIFDKFREAVESTVPSDRTFVHRHASEDEVQKSFRFLGFDPTIFNHAKLSLSPCNQARAMLEPTLHLLEQGSQSLGL